MSPVHAVRSSQEGTPEMRQADAAQGSGDIPLSSLGTGRQLSLTADASSHLRGEGRSLPSSTLDGSGKGWCLSLGTQQCRLGGVS